MARRKKSLAALAHDLPTAYGQQNEIKRRKNKNNFRFSIYIFKVLRQVHPELSMTNKAMKVMDDFMYDIFTRLVAEAAVLVKFSKKSTLSSSEFQTATRLILPGELARHAVSDATKAVANFMRSKSGDAYTKELRKLNEPGIVSSSSNSRDIDEEPVEIEIFAPASVSTPQSQPDREDARDRETPMEEGGDEEAPTPPSVTPAQIPVQGPLLLRDSSIPSPVASPTKKSADDRETAAPVGDNRQENQEPMEEDEEIQSDQKVAERKAPEEKTRGISEIAVPLTPPSVGDEESEPLDEGSAMEKGPSPAKDETVSKVAGEGGPDSASDSLRTAVGVCDTGNGEEAGSSVADRSQSSNVAADSHPTQEEMETAPSSAAEACQSSTGDSFYSVAESQEAANVVETVPLLVPEDEGLRMGETADLSVTSKGLLQVESTQDEVGKRMKTVPTEEGREARENLPIGGAPSPDSDAVVMAEPKEGVSAPAEEPRVPVGIQEQRPTELPTTPDASVLGDSGICDRTVVETDTETTMNTSDVPPQTTDRDEAAVKMPLHSTSVKVTSVTRTKIVHTTSKVVITDEKEEKATWFREADSSK